MQIEELRTTALQKLQEALEQKPPRGQLSDERYDQAHELFERSSDQQSKILAWLEEVFSSYFTSLDPLRILSVGCGSGILDNPLIRSLAARSKQIIYTGVDPNGSACRRFRNDFDALRLANVQLDLREQRVEAVCPSQRFDLILAVHSLYYVANPAATLDFLLRLVAPGGQLVVIQAPEAELNQLANHFWYQHADSAIWFSDRVARHLSECRLRFFQRRIDGWVDVAPCFVIGCPRGKMMLDFILQTDCRHLEDHIVQLCRRYLRAASRPENDRLLAAHPTDAFIIEPPKHSFAAQAPETLDRPARSKSGTRT